MKHNKSELVLAKEMKMQNEEMINTMYVYQTTYVSLKYVWLYWYIMISFNYCLAHILSYSNSFHIKYSKLINY